MASHLAAADDENMLVPDLPRENERPAPLDFGKPRHEIIDKSVYPIVQKV